MGRGPVQLPGKTLQDADPGGREVPCSLPGPCDAPGLRQGRTWDAFDAGPGGGCAARWAARLKKCVCEGLGMCLGEM